MNLWNTQNRQSMLANIIHSLKISLAIHQLCSTPSDLAAVNSGSKNLILSTVNILTQGSYFTRSWSGTDGGRVAAVITVCVF